MRPNHELNSSAHEETALEYLGKKEVDKAQVRAILALASAVNRLADAQESIAAKS